MRVRNPGFRTPLVCVFLFPLGFYLALFSLLWIGIVFMPIRIRLSILRPIRIWIGIETMPIHMRILPQVLHKLENWANILLLFTVMPVYNVFFSYQWQICHVLSIFAGILKFSCKKKKI
jgi:hypothetical protein